jgi:signal transduction histidine kinase
MEQKEIILFLIIVSITIAIFITAILVFILFYRKKVIKQINEKEELKSEHQQELLTTQIEIQNQTMQYIGREIHDNIGQKLTLASLYTQQLAYENKAPQIKGSIESISTIINESLSELRELSKSLTDNSIDSNSISSLLETECSKINELKITKVIFTTNANQIKLDYQRKSVLLRITQEFIQNSIKHANCNNIFISLHKSNNLLQLKLADDGKGFDVNVSQLTKSGIGLSNMKKRAEIIGGKYDIQSNSNGTKVVVEIPISL